MQKLYLTIYNIVTCIIIIIYTITTLPPSAHAMRPCAYYSRTTIDAAQSSSEEAPSAGTRTQQEKFIYWLQRIDRIKLQNHADTIHKAVRKALIGLQSDNYSERLNNAQALSALTAAGIIFKKDIGGVAIAIIKEGLQSDSYYERLNSAQALSALVAAGIIFKEDIGEVDIAKIKRGLQSGNYFNHLYAAQALSALITGGIITKEDIGEVDIAITIAIIKTGLQSNDSTARLNTAQILSALIVASIITKEDIDEVDIDKIKDKIKEALQSDDSKECLYTAQALSVLVAAGIIFKEDIGEDLSESGLDPKYHNLAIELILTLQREAASEEQIANILNYLNEEILELYRILFTRENTCNLFLSTLANIIRESKDTVQLIALFKPWCYEGAVSWNLQALETRVSETLGISKPSLEQLLLIDSIVILSPIPAEELPPELKEDYIKALAESDTVNALRLKQRAYIKSRSSRGLSTIPLPKDQDTLNALKAIYKLDWNTFCKLMDSGNNYKESHKNPVEFFKKLTTEETPSAGTRTQQEQFIYWLQRADRIKLQNHADTIHKAVRKAIIGLQSDDSNECLNSAQTLLAFIPAGIISKEDIGEVDIAKIKKGLQSNNHNKRLASAQALSELKTAGIIFKEDIGEVDIAMITEYLQSDNHNKRLASAQALSALVSAGIIFKEDIGEDLSESGLDPKYHNLAIELILTLQREGASEEQIANILNYLNEEILELYRILFTRENTSNLFLSTLANIIRESKDTAQLIALFKPWCCEGAMSWNLEALETRVSQTPGAAKPSLEQILLTDNIVILSPIPAKELSPELKEDYIKALAESDTANAIRLKQRVYINSRSSRGLSTIPLPQDQDTLNALKAIYKLDWNTFCKLMDKGNNYQRCHVSPVAFARENNIIYKGSDKTDSAEVDEDVAKKRLDEFVRKNFSEEAGDSGVRPYQAFGINLAVCFPNLTSGMNYEKLKCFGHGAIDNLDLALAEGLPLYQAVLVQRYCYKQVGIEMPDISDYEYRILWQLSLDIHDILSEAEYLPDSNERIEIDGELVFREVVRFNKFFSRYYRKDPSKIFDYYFLTAWTVYGRFIETRMQKNFLQLLRKVCSRPEFAMLYAAASVNGGTEINNDRAKELLNFGTFKQPIPGNIPNSQRKVLAAAERARVCGMPLTTILPANQFPDLVADSLESDNNNIVFVLPMSGFTQETEFSGLYATDPDTSELKWCRGALAWINEVAKANPDKRVYMVLENIDWASGDLRLSLHQPLLDHKAVFKNQTDEDNKPLGEQALEQNLHFVMTMSEDIGDESFMDRTAGYFLDEPDTREIKDYLVNKAKLNTKVAEYIVDTLYTAIKDNDQLHEEINLQDIIQIGYYASGRIRDNHLTDNLIDAAKKEAYLHLSVRFSGRDDHSRLAAIKSILGIKSEPKFKVEIADNGESLVCEGIKFKVDSDSDFGKFLSKNYQAGMSFADAVENFVREQSKDTRDYFLTALEENIFCLLARVRKYAPTKIAFLQGLPGGGKTTIARLFSDILGAKQVELTLNKEVDISLFRGGFSIGPEGVINRDARMWQELPRDNRTFIYNEADTRMFFLQWMRPHWAGRRYRWDIECPDPAATVGRPFRRIDFGEDQMFIFTGNVRAELPEIMTASMPARYAMELSSKDVRYRCKRLFESWSRRKGVSMQAEVLNRYADKLSSIYNSLYSSIRQDLFESDREVTPRHIERFSKLFFGLMENNAGDAKAKFDLLIEVMFLRMWELPEDVSLARNAIAQYYTNTSPPNTAQLIDFIRNYNLNVPLLLLDNGTVGFERLREAVLSGEEDVVERRIDLSNSHTKTHLIGGLSRSADDASPANKRGILSDMILEAHLVENPTFCWVFGYLNSDPQVSPLLNEFFQTNWLQTEDILDDLLVVEILKKVSENGAYSRIRGEYSQITGNTLPENIDQLSLEEKRDLARYLISYKPSKLQIIAFGPSGQEIILHPADIDRFFTINVSEDVNPKWIEEHIEDRLKGFDRLVIEKAKESAVSAWKYNDKQVESGLYDHNRMGSAELDAFLDELQNHNRSGDLDENITLILAYHILGIGLVRNEEAGDSGEEIIDYRKEFLEDIGLDLSEALYSRDVIQEDGHVVFNISVEFRGKRYDIATERSDYVGFEKIDDYGRYKFIRENGESVDGRLQAGLQSHLSQEASALLARTNRLIAIVEGDPGGGKTSSSEELTMVTGRPHHEEGMYQHIDLSSVLGGPIIKENEIVLNALDKDSAGRYVLDFLRVYSEGGSYVADEGRVSETAGYLLEWLAQANKQDEIDLGDYHPGLQGIKIKRDNSFSFTITQNYWFKTEGREQLQADLDHSGIKIRVDSVLSMQDAVTLIEYYLDDADIGDDIKGQFARLHIKLSKEHPQKNMLSPRDLIEVINRIKNDGLGVLNQQLSISYLEGVINDHEKKIVFDLIKSVFAEFAIVDYQDVVIEKSNESNVSETSIESLKHSPLMTEKAKALHRMITSGGRQMLVVQPEGGFGLDLVKLYCNLSGQRIDIFETNGFITAQQLLEGESFLFEDSFDAQTNSRKAVIGANNKPVFTGTRGRIGRYMIKAGTEDMVPESERISTVIVLPAIESMPVSELIKLNRLLTSRKTLMRDENGRLCEYELPRWVNIVGVTSDLNKLTSPFANRFKKLVLPFDYNTKSLHDSLRQDYPSLSAMEVEWLKHIAWTAWIFRRNEEFELLDSYFTPHDLNELALTVQMLKQRDNRKGQVKHDPLRYVLEAVHYVYLAGLFPIDRENFEKNILLDGFLVNLFPNINPSTLRNYYHVVSKEIENNMADIQYREHNVEINYDSFSNSPHFCDNEIVVTKRDGDITIITPAKAYTLKWGGLESKEEKCSGGLSVARRGKKLILKLQLIKSIGGWDLPYDQKNLDRALPWQEMGADEFMVPTKPLAVSMAALFQSSMVVRTASNRIVPSRIVLMPGETGSGKTSLCNMLSRAQGIPVVRINPDRQMRDTDLFSSLAFRGEVQMDIKDFLMSIGKLRVVKQDGTKIRAGKWQRLEAGFSTSTRMMILVDEANITKEVWGLLDAIARGEKRFTIETQAGDIIEVELDAEVQIVLTYNPPEYYGGTGSSGNRFNFPDNISSKARKVYIGEPLKIFDREELLSIIGELYRRGDGYAARTEKMKGIKLPPSKPGFFSVAESILKVKDIGLPAIEPIAALKRRIEKDFYRIESEEIEEEDDLKKEIEIDEQIRERAEKKAKAAFKFDHDELTNAISALEKSISSLAKQEAYRAFCNTILCNYFNGACRGRVEKNLFKRLQSLAMKIDNDLADIVGDFYRVEYQSQPITILFRLDANAKKQNIYLKNLKVLESNERRTITFEGSCIIKDRKRFEPQKLRDILGDEDYNLVFADDVIPEVFVLDEKPGDSALAYYDSVRKDLISFDLEDKYMIDLSSSHELGHYVSEAIGLSQSVIQQRVSRILDSNIEVYSTLFPILFIDDAKKYISDWLVPLAKNLCNGSAKQDDAYALAAKEVLNAFAIRLGNENFKHRFNPEEIDNLIKQIKMLSPNEIFQYACEIFIDPRKYFPTVEVGKYYKQSIQINTNGAMRDVPLGEQPRFTPNVVVEQVGHVDVIVDEVQEGKSLIDDETSVEKQMERAISYELPASARKWMLKYAKLFAKDRNDKRDLRTVPHGGTAINPQGILEGNPNKMFFAPKYEDEVRGITQNVMFVIDVSGSISGNTVLREALQDMICQYSIFILELSRKNPDLNFGLAVVNTEFTPLFNFKQWVKAKSYKERKKLVYDAIGSMWKGGAGIAGTAVLDGLSKIEYPQVANKKTYNLAMVFTDGQECGGSAQGDPLKEQIRDFREGKHDLQEGQKGKKRQKIDIVFTGLNFSNEAVDLPTNYPCYLMLPGEVTAEAYLEALFRVAYMQTKHKLDGDLSLVLRNRGSGPNTGSRLAPNANPIFTDKRMLPFRSSVIPMHSKASSAGTIARRPRHDELLDDLLKGSTTLSLEYPKPTKNIPSVGEKDIIDSIRSAA